MDNINLSKELQGKFLVMWIDSELEKGNSYRFTNSGRLVFFEGNSKIENDGIKVVDTGLSVDELTKIIRNEEFNLLLSQSSKPITTDFKPAR